MFKHRFHLPSPALAISLIALFVALGGTGYAAIHLPKNSVGAKQLKTNAVTSSKIKNHAVTAAKINTSGLTVPNAVQATTATNATSATNATNASNSTELGGVAASGYVQNAGNTFISVGSSNWQSFNSTDPTKWLYTTNATWATSPGAGTFTIVAHPSVPTAAYGKNLEATAARLCYTASTSATLVDVDVTDARYSNSGVGTTTTLDEDLTNRTDSACRTYTFGTPVVLSALDDLGLTLTVTYTGTNSTFFVGQSGFTLVPTTAVASASTASGGASLTPTLHGTATR